MIGGTASAIPTIYCRSRVRLEATGPRRVLTLVFSINDAQTQLTRR
jgi:hypothetical protein